MTLEEFDAQVWVKGMKAIYDFGEYEILQVDFEYRFLFLKKGFFEEWIECGKVKLVDNN